MKDAQIQLSYTVIKAPASGRVGRKSVEVGQRLQVGQPLMAIVEDNPWVVANFKETQLEKIRPKQAVDLEIDTFPSHVFRGRVDSIAPGPGINSRCCLLIMQREISPRSCSGFRSRLFSTRTVSRGTRIFWHLACPRVVTVTTR